MRSVKSGAKGKEGTFLIDIFFGIKYRYILFNKNIDIFFLIDIFTIYNMMIVLTSVMKT